MKKILAIALSVIMALSMIACASENAASTETKAEAATEAVAEVAETEAAANNEAESKKLLLGIAINDLDEFQTANLGYWQDYCAKKGYDFIYTNAAGNIEKQIADVESLIAQSPDAICIEALDSNALVTSVDACVDAGIPVLELTYGINSDKCIHLPVTENGHYDCGVFMGEHAVDWLNAHPDETLKVGYMWGSKAMDVCDLFYDGMYEAIDKAGMRDRFTILDEQDANWSADEAMKIMENWLQGYSDMNCVITQADQCSSGAVAAIQAAGGQKGDYVVIGRDPKSDSIPLIKDGWIYGSVLMDNEYMTRYTIDAMVDTINGKYKPGDTVLGDHLYAKITGEYYK